MSKFIDLTEQKFSRLIVIKRVDNTKRGKLKWLCLCECGKETTILGYHLRNGNTKSCGCLWKETMTKHGHYNDPPYYSWANMIQRCTNPNHTAYKNYGSRGITVCKRWRKFQNFLEDMGERPESLTLERIKNKLGYYKENCKWATKKEQSRNKRNNRTETYNGEKQCITVWAKEYNISCRTLRRRLYEWGWSMEKALTTPIRKKVKSK